jgi:hypothetical protein
MQTMYIRTGAGAAKDGMTVEEIRLATKGEIASDTVN